MKRCSTGGRFGIDGVPRPQLGECAVATWDLCVRPRVFSVVVQSQHVVEFLDKYGCDKHTATLQQHMSYLCISERHSFFARRLAGHTTHDKFSFAASL